MSRTAPLAALIVMTLAGCAIPGVPQLGAPATATPVESSEVAITNAPPPTLISPPAPTGESPESAIPVVRIWTTETFSPSSDVPGGETLIEQLAAFDEAHPEIEVEVLVKRLRGPGGMLAYLRSAPPVAPAILPDIVLLDREALVVAASEGLIAPLDNLVDQRVRGELFPVAASLGMVENRLVGLPYMLEIQHTIYRTTVFAEPPVGFDDVLEGAAPFFFAAGTVGGVNQTTLAQYLAAGGITANADGTPVLDPGALRLVLTFYSVARENQRLDPAVFQMTDAGQVWTLYDNRQAHLAAITSTLYLSHRADLRNSAVSWIPSADGRPFALATGWLWALATSDPDRQQAAMAVLDYLMEPANHGTYAAAVGWLPSQRAALAVWGDADPYAAFSNTLLNAAQPLPDAAALGLVGEAIQQSVENVLLNNMLPIQATNLAVQSVTPSPVESP